MFPKYMPPSFVGDYYEVGYQHAQWWIRYFRQRACQSYHDFYRRLLMRCWKPRFKPLFINTLDAYPEIIFEILGMAQALSDADYKTSPLDVFANCLGETGYKGSQCTSFVSFENNAVILAHNEEESEVAPLCICNATITGKSQPINFMTASYPFQLLGSGLGGVNQYFAFQGNSIGYTKYIQSIESTWEDRLPKTVFTRKWLEFSSLKEVLDMCSQWLFSLPSHNYFISPENAYSMEIRPYSKFMWRPLHQVTLNKLSNFHCHTNQFIVDEAVDQKWVWKYPVDRKESFVRLNCIENLATKYHPVTKSNAMNVISMIAKDERYASKTSASFVIDTSNDNFNISISSWFNMDKHHFEIQSARCVTQF